MESGESDTGRTTGAGGRAMPQPTLETDRLVIRPFRDSDADTVQTLLQSRKIAANTSSIEHPYPEGAAALWIGTHAGCWARGDSVVFAITDKQQLEEVRGAIGLEIHARDENAELGYWVGEPWWGRGYATEAAKAVLEFGFSTLGLKKIYAHHHAKNPASGRVMQKIGMQQEGYMKCHVKKWGRFEDVIYYGVLYPIDPDFQKVNANRK